MFTSDEMDMQEYFESCLERSDDAETASVDTMVERVEDDLPPTDGWQEYWDECADEDASIQAALKAERDAYQFNLMNNWGSDFVDSSLVLGYEMI